MVDLSLLGNGILDIVQRVFAAFPNAVLLSGKRTLEGQANAMASDIVLDRNFISKTYAQSIVATACQSWVTTNPTALSQQAIAAGLLSVLQTFTPEQLRLLSLHFDGNAVDWQVVGGPIGDQMVAFIQQCVTDAGGKFLTREGGLSRWHCEVPVLICEAPSGP